MSHQSITSFQFWSSPMIADYTQIATTLPILYSFRRCPYAMRARMAIVYSNFNCALREVDLKNKPQELLNISPKATVPVLHLPNGQIIDESIDIITHVLQHSDPAGWNNLSKKEHAISQELIQLNDNEFVPYLRKYKYFEHHPQQTQEQYRNICENTYISLLEQHLSNHKNLISNNITVADIAIMPFIRQFAKVDYDWFSTSQYSNLRAWLDNLSQNDIFTSAMVKIPMSQ